MKTKLEKTAEALCILILAPVLMTLIGLAWTLLLHLRMTLLP